MASLKRHKTLDEAANERAAGINIDERIQSIEDFRTPEHRYHYVERVFMPSLRDMYDTIDSELQKSFGGDDKSVYGKEEEIMKAAVAGLKKHFTRVRPSLVKDLDAVGGIKEQYAFLAQQYDDLHGGDERHPLISNIHALAHDKDAKVHSVLGHVNMKKLYDHASGGFAVEANKHANHQLHGLERTHLYEHVKGKLGGAGYNVKDNLAFRTQLNTGDYVNLAIGLKTGDFGADRHGNAKTIRDYFLEKAKPKKEEK